MITICCDLKRRTLVNYQDIALSLYFTLPVQNLEKITMATVKSMRLIIPLAIVQIVFLIIFGIKIEYHETAKPVDTVKPSIAGGLYPSKLILEISIL